MPSVNAPIPVGKVFQDSPTTEPYTGALENRFPQFNPANCSCQCGCNCGGSSNNEDVSRSILRAAHVYLLEKPQGKERALADLICPGNSATVPRRHSTPQYNSVQPAVAVVLTAEKLWEPHHLVQGICDHVRLPGKDAWSETSETRPTTPSSIHTEPPQSGSNSMASSVVSLLSMRSATPSYILMGLASECSGSSEEDRFIGSFKAMLPMHETGPGRSFFVQAPLWLTAQPRYCLPSRAWGTLSRYPAVIADEDVVA